MNFMYALIIIFEFTAIASAYLGQIVVGLPFTLPWSGAELTIVRSVYILSIIYGMMFEHATSTCAAAAFGWNKPSCVRVHFVPAGFK